jgi:hypothetical protein
MVELQAAMSLYDSFVLALLIFVIGPMIVGGLALLVWLWRTR